MRLKLTLDGKVYEVEVEASDQEAPTPAFIPPWGGAPRGAPGASSVPTASPSTAGRASEGPSGNVDETKVCRSPVSGLVTRVAAKPGQSIQVGDELMVLEAMKMETVIAAPISGKVARVLRSPGEPVKRGEVLVEFE